MSNTKTKYSDEEFEEVKEKIPKKIKRAEEGLTFFQNPFKNGIKK